MTKRKGKRNVRVKGYTRRAPTILGKIGLQKQRVRSYRRKKPRRKR